jgi:hypothetical protein
MELNMAPGSFLFYTHSSDQVSCYIEERVLLSVIVTFIIIQSEIISSKRQTLCMWQLWGKNSHYPIRSANHGLQEMEVSQNFCAYCH